MKYIFLGIAIVMALTGMFVAGEKSITVEIEQVPMVGRYQLVLGGENGSYLYRIDTTTGKIERCDRGWTGEYSRWTKL